jgi:cystathionine beta-lyase/cystathionine gamma-synthase
VAELRELTFSQKANVLCSPDPEPQPFDSIAPPIFQTANFAISNEARNPYIYTGLGNPTLHLVEEKLRLIEGGAAAKLFSSGMAAINSVFLSTVKSGDHIVTVHNIYGGVRSFLHYLSKTFQVSVTFTDGSVQEIGRALRAETAVIYLETPGSHLFEMQDVAAVKAAAGQHSRLVVDNTWATPMFQNPLLLGADLVVHSATKFLGGHNDIMGGVVIGGKKQVKSIHNFGAVMDPHQAWLLNRSLSTLPVRVKQLEANAMAVALHLESQSRVQEVIYPGLPSHPQYELGKRQMSGYTSLMSIRTEDSEWITRLKRIPQAWSYGGARSLVMDYGSGLVRLYVGLEPPELILEDLEQALTHV